MPAGQRRAFSPHATLAGVFIATHLDQLSNVMVEPICAPTRQSASDQEVNHDPLQPGEISGLSKSEAEDLLDLLEAAGYELCQLSFVDGEGFSVRPRSHP